jgi:hypothetical protein
MTPTVLIICFIAMAIFTATVLVIGTMMASGMLPRHPHHDEPQPPRFRNGT